MIIHEERFTRSLPVRFTADELRGKADELADKFTKSNKLEEEKKQVGADYKARLDTLGAEMKQLSRHISEKCEYQQVECQAYLDYPEIGKKTIYRTDTGDQVGIETMTPADRQMAIQWIKDQEGHTANPLENVTVTLSTSEQTVEVAEESFAASIDDGVVDHDGGGQSHEAEE